jgi:hypothetical protein
MANRLISVFLVMLLCQGCASAQGGDSCPITIRVTADEKSVKTGIVAITFTNSSPQPVSLSNFLLPWLTRNAMDILAIRSDGSQISNWYPLFHPFSKEMLIIAPADNVSEELSLDEYLIRPSRISGFASTTVFWRWAHEVDGAECRLHGSLYIE